MTSVPEFEEHPFQQTGLVTDIVLGVVRLPNADGRLDGLPVLVGLVQEVDDLVHGLVLKDDHVFGQGLHQRSEATLGIVPGIHR